MPSASNGSPGAGASKAKTKAKAPVPTPSSKSRAAQASTASAPASSSSSSSAKPSTRSTRAGLSTSRLAYGSSPVTTNRPTPASLTAAHPRTDPLGALTHLLKLLAALPARVGGCAYRLTPGEHALAVHLVEVLDPYVCAGARAMGVSPPGAVGNKYNATTPGAGARAGPSSASARGTGTGEGTSAMLVVMNGLVNQPTEILDAILAHLDERRDVRAAGLTCRRLAQVVFPRHFEYRVIRCKVSDIAVWHHLARNRALARNVRRVEVVDERTALTASTSNGTASSSFSSSTSASASTSNSKGRLPMLIPRGIRITNTDLENSSSSSSSSTDSDEVVPPSRSRSSLGLGSMHAKQERLLAAALTRMTGLTHFSWACAHAPIQLLRAVWPALMRGGTAGAGAIVGGRLVKVEVCDNLMFAPRRVESESESSESSSSGGESEGSASEAEAEADREGESDSDSDTDTDTDNDANPLAVVVSRSRANRRRVSSPSMLSVETAHFRSTAHAYGAAKQPELSRIAAMLSQCANLKDLEITYMTPRAQGSTSLAMAIAAAAAPAPARTRPLADDLLMYGRWTHLTSLVLVNLRCASPVAPAAFLSAHAALEVLHLDVVIGGGVGVGSQVAAGAGAGGGGGAGAGATGRAALQLEPGSLPRLREIRASKEVINAVLECPLALDDHGHGAHALRPLEVVKGFKLSGTHATHAQSPSLSGAASSSRSVPDAVFLENLKKHAGSIKRVELSGWHDMEDVRRLAAATPNVQHLDVGRRIGYNARSAAGAGASASVSWAGGGGGMVVAPVTNMVEWAELLAALPELTAVHGVRFFYEVSAGAIGNGGPAILLSNGSTAVGSSSSNAASSSLNAVGNSTSWSGQDVMSMASGSGSTKPAAQLSMVDRSRMRKNDEIAGVLAWKCRKLRRVDHWEENSGKVIVLTRDHESAKDREKDREREGKARWEVRRVKYL